MSTESSFYLHEALPIAFEDRDPRETFDRCGAEILYDVELLGVFLNISRERGYKALESQPLGQLIELPLQVAVEVFGKAKARQFLCAVEFVRRSLDKGLGTMPPISSPVETLPYLAKIREACKENLLCLYLNARNQVVHQEIISVGSLSTSIVHPRECFRPAIEHCAASVVFSHNHPSGDCSASRDDIDLTRRLVKAGELLGIDVLDHIIIARKDFLSMKERGLMS